MYRDDNYNSLPILISGNIKTEIQDIADLFDVTRPSVSRIISEFVKENIISKEKRNIIKILDYNRLIQKLD